MSKAEYCDFCEEKIMQKFTDSKYKITEIKHGYDGFAPFLDRWSVDICPRCMQNLTQNMDKMKKVIPDGTR